MFLSGHQFMIFSSIGWAPVLDSIQKWSTTSFHLERPLSNPIEILFSFFFCPWVEFPVYLTPDPEPPFLHPDPLPRASTRVRLSPLAFSVHPSTSKCEDKVLSFWSFPKAPMKPVSQQSLFFVLHAAPHLFFPGVPGLSVLYRPTFDKGLRGTPPLIICPPIM